ncbi:hypothetical protein IAE49_04640 [Kosakonia sp. S58]|uniref:DUF3592 domain-containing protein n=1 Tax=unclassified Kosakonia TaxID=2632876 RepID=UPI001906C0E4|nr:hypothetical protein [Kosakonia sp. S57]MBK0085520.1 hypothetical protein [Kosakonia sp. S58]
MSIGNDIGLLLSIAAPCALIGWVFYTGSVYYAFKKHGGRTVAEITNIKQTSTSGTGSPKCVFSLSFKTLDGKEIHTNHTQVVTVLDLMKLERERKLDIYYNKKDPGKVWLILKEY